MKLVDPLTHTQASKHPNTATILMWMLALHIAAVIEKFFFFKKKQHNCCWMLLFCFLSVLSPQLSLVWFNSLFTILFHFHLEHSLVTPTVYIFQKLALILCCANNYQIQWHFARLYFHLSFCLSVQQLISRQKQLDAVFLSALRFFLFCFFWKTFKTFLHKKIRNLNI